MSRRSSSPLSSVSPTYLEALYRQFRSNPSGLDASWQCLFGILDMIGETDGVDMLASVASGGTEAADLVLADLLRSRGHLHAKLDPLSSASGATADAMAVHRPPPPSETMAARYLGSLSVETAHIDNPTLRHWLIDAAEADWQPAPADQIAVLYDLIRASEFESFMGRKFPTKKRFGAEGAEAIIPLLRGVLCRAAAAGVTHVVIGSMHRGRLNIVTNILGRPLARLVAEIKGAHPFPADTSRPGDVPYHLGHRATVATDAGTLDVTLLANPSHLEAVDPVVLGSARAVQDALGSKARVLPIVIHTDAAVIAQGVVAETLQLANVPGFAIGGTVHLVVNNQIGFTTEAHEARTSTHCTGAWKAVDSAILHVNGDDADAVVRAAGLAVDWRQTHARDAVIDLVCYRRNGHNEIDEPTFTQPLAYRAIALHTPVAEATARRLIESGVVTEEAVAAFKQEFTAALNAEFEASATFRTNESGYKSVPNHLTMSGAPTGVDPDRLHILVHTLGDPPADMTLHPKMGRLLRQRRSEEGGVAWPMAEALALGTLLQDGVPVRLTGQDVVRGAFSHRHYSLVDNETGHHHTVLGSLGPAPFSIHNSPLSEYAVLGFEYGYSLEATSALTIWEAQFGDFANGAQIILDQFIVAGEEKWCTPSGLVVLLPHGLEGQGPEHSSGRIERFLQMAAGDNIQIANPSTPANYFHLLRRQALSAVRKPLIILGTKRLLRLPAATSPLAEFGPDQSFKSIIVDAPSEPVERILLCSGKLAYDLVEERARRRASVAIVRLEELYPLPEAGLRTVFARWPDARCLWVQEEPSNMGAWSWLDRRLERLRREAGLATPTVVYVGRPEAGSPAGSFHDAHDADQAHLVARAFDA